MWKVCCKVTKPGDFNHNYLYAIWVPDTTKEHCKKDFNFSLMNHLPLVTDKFYLKYTTLGYLPNMFICSKTGNFSSFVDIFVNLLKFSFWIVCFKNKPLVDCWYISLGLYLNFMFWTIWYQFLSEILAFFFAVSYNIYPFFMHTFIIVFL